MARVWRCLAGRRLIGLDGAPIEAREVREDHECMTLKVNKCNAYLVNTEPGEGGDDDDEPKGFEPLAKWDPETDGAD